MSKYYNVNLYRLTIDWSMERLEEIVGRAVVKKGVFFAKGLDGKRYRIVDQVFLDNKVYDYDEEDFEQDYLYYSDYEEQIRAPYQQDSFMFEETIVVKRDEFTYENKMSPLELIDYNSEMVTTKEKVKSFIKSKLKK